MGCYDEYDTCGESSKVPAKCVPYFGIVNSESSLTDDKCKTMHKVAEDIYQQLDTLFNSISLEGLTADCIEIGAAPTIVSLFQQILDYVCELKYSSSGGYISNPADPCSGEVVTPNGLEYYSFANGILPITSTINWNYGSSDLYESNMNYKVMLTGVYKITIEVEVPLAGTDELLVGIAKNNVMPIQDFSTLESNFSIRRANISTPRTFNFIKELEAGDVIKLGFKKVVGAPVVSSSILIVEKVK